jgi:cyclase
MYRRHPSFPPLSLIAVLGLSTAVIAQEPPPELQITPVAPHIFMLSGPGGNICLVTGDNGALLIDAGYEQLAPKVMAAIREKTDKPLRFVINTHWHLDHVGGNQAFATTGTQIIAHDSVRKRMSAEQLLGGLDRRMPPAPAAALPTLTYASALTLHGAGQETRIVHFDPAHTDGDSVVFFDRPNVVATGDLYFNGLYPYIDVNAGGSIDGMIAAADRLLELVHPDTKIIPGHGPLSTPQELRAFRQMLVTVRERVQPLVQAGQTRDQVLAAKPTADLDEKWGRGIPPDVFVGVVYDSLTRH